MSVLLLLLLVGTVVAVFTGATRWWEVLLLALLGFLIAATPIARPITTVLQNANWIITNNVDHTPPGGKPAPTQGVQKP